MALNCYTKRKENKNLYNTLLQMPSYYKAGIYIRLSEADEGKSYESDSESVLNQRNMLMNYVKEKGFIFVGEYVDDGYSGTDFERPGFEKLIEDVKNKVINLVIVKDLSRFSRNMDALYKIVEMKEKYNTDFIALDNTIDTRQKNSLHIIKAIHETYKYFEKQRREIEKEFEE